MLTFNGELSCSSQINPQSMFNDQFNKRVLATCLGLSLVLCSISLMMFSFGHIQSAQAAPTTMSKPAPWDDQLRGGVALGIVKDTGYFVVFGRPNNVLYKVDLAKAKDWYSE